MKIRDHFNAMLRGALIIGLDRAYGEDPVMGWITKSLVFLFIGACLYVNLKGDE
jgi:TM2 domain-containing membrane protein YozV